MSVQEGPKAGILFSLVARGAFTLAEYSEATGSFREVAGRLPAQLCRMPPGTRKTFVHQGHAFHCLIAEAPDFAERLVFIAMAPESFSPSASFAFLADIERRFRSELEIPPGPGGAAAVDHSGFARVLRERAAYYSTDPSATRIREARALLDQTRSVMARNIDLALDRGERIEVLVDKTDRLSSSSHSFRTAARRTRRRMACNRCRVTFLLVLLVLIVLAIAFFLLCWFGIIPPFWKNWFKPHNHSSSSHSFSSSHATHPVLFSSSSS